MENKLVRDIEQRFARLCAEAGRCGVIGFAPVRGVRLLPEQAQRLQQKLSTAPAKAGLSSAEDADFSAVSFGLFYHESEILAIPATWQSKKAGSERWNDYARAYQELNRTLDYVSGSLATEFGGVAEKATIEGWAGKVQHVGDYFAHCVSHRAFAEAAGLGWRGRHGLIVTPEAGPALRFATVFVPYPPRTSRHPAKNAERSSGERGTEYRGRGMEYRVRSQARELAGCGDCRACLDVCPILRETHPANPADPANPANNAGWGTENAGRSTGNAGRTASAGRGSRPERGRSSGNTGRSSSDYREACRRRIDALGLAADVCGICVRVCWERVCR